MSPCSLVLRGFRSGEGGDELIEHGSTHGELASGRVVTLIESNLCARGNSIQLYVLSIVCWATAYVAFLGTMIEMLVA